ncbi:hypothetical protein ACLOJK_007265 [Asimina triloba]
MKLSHCRTDALNREKIWIEISPELGEDLDRNLTGIGRGNGRGIGKEIGKEIISREGGFGFCNWISTTERFREEDSGTYHRRKDPYLRRPKGERKRGREIGDLELGSETRAGEIWRRGDRKAEDGSDRISPAGREMDWSCRQRRRRGGGVDSRRRDDNAG